MDPQETISNMISAYDAAVASDKTITKMQRLLNDGKGGYSEVNELAGASGSIVGKIIAAQLKEMYPEGRIPRVEIEPILIPLMQHNHDFVAAAAEKAQNKINEDVGVGLKAIRPEFDMDRAKEFVREISDGSFDDDFTW